MAEKAAPTGGAEAEAQQVEAEAPAAAPAPTGAADADYAPLGTVAEERAAEEPKVEVEA
jgi:hypothetical protein